MATVFQDLNAGVNVDTPLQYVYDADSINQSIVTILDTKKGTRLFNRDFGSNLLDLLFDPMTDITVMNIKSALIDAIQQWETRINLLSAEVIPDYTNQQYFVNLRYTIPELGNRTANFSFNLVYKG